MDLSLLLLNSFIQRAMVYFIQVDCDRLLIHLALVKNLKGGSVSVNEDKKNSSLSGTLFII